MKTLLDYVKEYGNKSYEELPFRDADTFVICNAIYAPIETSISAEFEPEPEKTFKEAIEDCYDYFNRKIISCGFILTKNPFRNLLMLREYSRYADLKVTGCRFIYNKDDDASFLGISFLLGDDTLLVFYRGTDDTIAGWLEDVDIFAKTKIPSQQICVDYLNEAAEAYPDRKIVVAGHSKGGYLALYAGIFCKPEVRTRIVKLYNHDGPGDKNYDWLRTGAFEQLSPVYRHYVPGASVFGMMLCHDDDYQVVKSNRLLAPFQHDIGSWGIENAEPRLLDDLSFVGKINKYTFRSFLDHLDDRTPKFYEAVVAILWAPGEETLLALSKKPVTSVRQIAKTISGLSQEHKQTLKSLGKDFASCAGKAVKQIRAETKEKKEALKQRIRQTA